MRTWIVCALIAPIVAGTLGGAAAAAESVDLALVLVADVSRSIDDDEFALQKQGYAAALKDPKVLAAIRSGPLGAVAISYAEFAGIGQARTVIDWMVIRDGESAADFADRLEATPRSFFGRTSISGAIDFARQSLKDSGFQASRRAIDVSGDGTNNSGRDVAAARDEAVAEGITINGLSIINQHPGSYIFDHVQPPGGLTEYYRVNVIGGPASFVREVHDFRTFGEAMTQKLIDEIACLFPAPASPPA